MEKTFRELTQEYLDLMQDKGLIGMNNSRVTIHLTDEHEPSDFIELDLTGDAKIEPSSYIGGDFNLWLHVDCVIGYIGGYANMFVTSTSDQEFIGDQTHYDVAKKLLVKAIEDLNSDNIQTSKKGKFSIDFDITPKPVEKDSTSETIKNMSPEAKKRALDIWNSIKGG